MATISSVKPSVTDGVINVPAKTGSKFFSRENLSITSKVTPSWLSSWEGKTILQKIEKVFVEIFRTILFCTLAIPMIAFTADMIKIAFQTKKQPEVTIKETPTVEIKNTVPPTKMSTAKKVMTFGGAAILGIAGVIFSSCRLGYGCPV